MLDILECILIRSYHILHINLQNDFDYCHLIKNKSYYQTYPILGGMVNFLFPPTFIPVQNENIDDKNVCPVRVFSSISNI